MICSLINLDIKRIGLQVSSIVIGTQGFKKWIQIG